MLKNHKVCLDLEAVGDVDILPVAFVVHRHLDRFRSCNRLTNKKYLIILVEK